MHNAALQVYLPRHRWQPLLWSCDFVFGRDTDCVRYIAHEGDTVRITDGIRDLTLISTFPNLHSERANWSVQAPQEPLARLPAAVTQRLGFSAEFGSIPVLFGTPKIEHKDGRIDCGIDLLGGIFFLLSRFEEIISTDRDSHDRFPASASLAHREDFLFHPMADVYRTVFMLLLQSIWPDWRPVKGRGEIQISCDVDEPFDRSVRSPMAFARTLGGDLIKRRSIGLALGRTLNYALRGLVGPRFDPCYTFDWYMDQCEAHGLSATFYFIAGNSAGLLDGTYTLDDPRILELFRNMADRGHSIAMHGSYNTYRDAARLEQERFNLNAALQGAGLAHDVVENRQHYLRWDATCTPDHLVQAGFRVDASGGFADMPGFRYGTARQFRMWSWQKLEPLDLVQKPLIVMEGSLLSSLYLNMNDENACHLAGDLKWRSMAFGGEFNLLWHNSDLETRPHRTLFSKLILDQPVQIGTGQRQVDMIRLYGASSSVDQR